MKDSYFDINIQISRWLASHRQDMSRSHNKYSIATPSTGIPGNLCEHGKVFSGSNGDYRSNKSDFRLNQSKGISHCGQIPAMGILIYQVMHNCQALVQICLTLMGHMASCIYVTLFTRLHFWCLHAWLWTEYTLSKHSMNTVLIIRTKTRVSLTWWKDLAQAWLHAPFLCPTPNRIIIADASLVGWGAYVDGQTALDTCTPWEIRMQ